ncbi:MAG: RDD family protein [Gammaproteobacteria bacterium]|nr:RDD family protein [Gammaproteobacteria bacterium]
MRSNVSLLSRLGAITYDFFLVFSLVFCIGLFVVIANQDGTKNPLFFLLMLLLTFSYFALSWVKGRQTLGMKAWKFEIMQADGSSVTYTQSLTRFILAPISLVVFIFPLFNKDRLPLHDYFSKTYLQSTKN